MSEDELLNKFRNCLEFGLGAKRAEADRLAETIMNLETRPMPARQLSARFRKKINTP